MAISNFAVWRIRLPATGVSNSNGGGFDATIAGAGIDYSQADAPILALTDLQCLVADDAGRLKIRSATGGFTVAMIGNAININGPLFFIVGYTSTNLVTLDRAYNATADVTGLSGKVGGAWADHTAARQTGDNTQTVQPWNKVYIMGSGNPSATPDYTWNGSDWGQNGCNGRISFLGEPGHMPHIRAAQGCIIVGGAHTVGNIYFSAGGSAYYNGIVQGAFLFYDCVVDQNGFDLYGSNATITEGCEFFNSAGTGGGTYPAVYCYGSGSRCVSTYVHNWKSHGIQCSTGGLILNCVAAKNQGAGIYCTSIDGNLFDTVIGCTVDGNLLDGIYLNYGYSELGGSFFLNNLITNHTGSGKYGITVQGTASP